MPFWETNLFSKQAAIIPKQQSISDLQDESTFNGIFRTGNNWSYGQIKGMKIFLYECSWETEPSWKTHHRGNNHMVSLLLTLTYLTSCSSVFIVNFEKVNATCDSAKNFHGNAIVYSKNFKFLFC